VIAAMALNLIMLGPPGAGKGTQAERLARVRGIPKISTGDILREEVELGTEIGRRAKAVMDRGGLIPDDVMIAIVRDRIGRPNAASGFVLDGFPRTVAQAEALDEIMTGRDPLVVVDIVVPEAELVHRLSSRMICADCGANAGGLGDAASTAEKVVMPLGAEGTAAESISAVQATTGLGRCRRCGGPLVQRTDDNAAVVLERLKVYGAQTRPLVEYYRRRPTFRSVDGAQAPDRVAADLVTAVEAARSSRLAGASGHGDVAREGARQ
jgi:adenylate kinase